MKPAISLERFWGSVDNPIVAPNLVNGVEAFRDAVVIACCVAGLSVHGRILLRGVRTRVDDRMLAVGRRVFVIGILGAWAIRVVRSATEI